MTPLPLNHVPTLAKALQIDEAEITSLLEQEYTMKITERLGIHERGAGDKADAAPILVQNQDADFMKKLYQAYRQADEKARQDFQSYCASNLNVRKA